MSPANPDSVTFEWSPSQNISESGLEYQWKLVLETHHAFFSTPPLFSPLIPPPHDAILPSLNWVKIPREIYGRGRYQRDFVPSESISFEVKGRPGINMGDALRREFAGLHGRDDSMSLGVGDAITCRFLVRPSW